MIFLWSWGSCFQHQFMHLWNGSLLLISLGWGFIIDYKVFWQCLPHKTSEVAEYCCWTRNHNKGITTYLSKIYNLWNSLLMLKLFPFFLPARQLYSTQKMFLCYYSIRPYWTIKKGLVFSTLHNRLWKRNDLNSLRLASSGQTEANESPWHW